MAITNGYCTLQQIKSATRITDAIDDSLLEMAVESASRMIDAECDRNFYSSGTATRDYVPNDAYVVDTDDLTEIVSVKIDDEGDQLFRITLAESDYQPEPLNQRVSGNTFPIYRLRMIGDYLFPIWGKQATVRIEGVFGFTPLTSSDYPGVRHCRPVKHLQKDSTVFWGSQALEILAPFSVGRVDPDVAQMIRPFKKYAVG
jgi:hypothetical protein